MMISFTTSGSYEGVERWLKKLSAFDARQILERYGRAGVAALSGATPVESGLTAASWSYSVKSSGGSYEITWVNSNINRGVNIAILLQYGHGTGTGGYVQGRDYINPAIRPVFDKIAEEAWSAVKP